MSFASQPLSQHTFDGFNGTVSTIGSNHVQYRGIRIASIGSDTVHHQVDGRIKSIGKNPVSYNSNGQITRVGPDGVTYTNGRITQIGHKVVHYIDSQKI